VYVQSGKDVENIIPLHCCVCNQKKDVVLIMNMYKENEKMELHLKKKIWAVSAVRGRITV